MDTIFWERFGKSCGSLPRLKIKVTNLTGQAILDV